jgi:hypothetical protein
LSNAEKRLGDGQDALLLEVQDRLKENNSLISIGNSIATGIADKLRLEWLKKLCVELKSLMTGVFVTNVATYRAVLALQVCLPGRLERVLIQEPFILEDAIGRISPVHLQFVNSWEAFDAVLELRFQDVQGYSKVQNKEYVLQEHATRRELNRDRPLEVSILPGQKIEMAVIFKNGEGQDLAQTTCPGCQSPSTKSQDCEIRW